MTPAPRRKNRTLETLRFALAPDSFFTIVVTNDVLRGPLPGSMGLIPQNTANLPALLSASFHQLVLEKMQSDEAYELVVRDSKSGFVFFNVEGHQYDYDAGAQIAQHQRRTAPGLGRICQAARTSVGSARSHWKNFCRREHDCRSRSRRSSTAKCNQRSCPRFIAELAPEPDVGTTPGPDVIVGNISDVIQSGSSVSGQVGISVGTDSCNPGTIDLDWFALPSNDHPVIPQNLYRMSGGTGNNDRFEQIGQSWLKHAFTAASSNTCGFGCNGVGGTHLGSGCSDLYSAGLNAGQAGLGSRAWVNPFTGVYPRGDSATPPRPHRPHPYRHIPQSAGERKRSGHDAKSRRHLLRRRSIRHSA